MEQYADIIIDLSVKNVDRIFQYRIPAHLREAVKSGVQVNVPFGKGDTVRKGIVVGLSMPFCRRGMLQPSRAPG